MKNFSGDTPVYVVASFRDRFLALFLDLSVVFVLSFPTTIILAGVETLLKITAAGSLGLKHELVMGAFRFLASFMISIFYYGYFYKRRGTSLGKSILNLKVVTLPCTYNPGYKTAFLRDFFGKMLSVFSFFIGYIIAFFRSDRRTLHDLIAGTVILKRVR